MTDYMLNPAAGGERPAAIPEHRHFTNSDIAGFHRSISGYRETPLVPLPGLAEKLGVGKIICKDESMRFGLNAFKGLGASYAIHRLLMEDDKISTFCTATDGNHGRAVAWASSLFNRKAVVFVPGHTVDARIRNIKGHGAEVIRVNGDYDETVSTAREQADMNGWRLVQDTAWPGYTDIPSMIMSGYLTAFTESEESVHPAGLPGIDIVFLQAGVGSFAASAAWYYLNRYGKNRPRLVCVEPSESDCLLRSCRQAAPSTTRKSQKTIMAGLNCGTASLTAWPVLERGIDLFLSIDDRYAEDAMRSLYHPVNGDTRIISGESGAAGMAALIAMTQEPGLAEAGKGIGLDHNSRIMVFNTEGDTDPDAFRSIVSG